MTTKKRHVRDLRGGAVVKRALLAVWDGIAVLGIVLYACLFLKDDEGGEGE